MSPPGRGRGGVRAGPLARITFALLVIATFLAIFYAQVRKHESPLLKRAWPAVVRFRPVGGSGAQPRLSREAHFKLRTSVGDTLDVSIVSGRSSLTVRALDPVRMHAYQHRSLTWDGRTAAGRLAAPGTYTLRIRFTRAGHTVTPPLRLVLEGPAR